jgi:hypothetical protein
LRAFQGAGKPERHINRRSSLGARRGDAPLTGFAPLPYRSERETAQKYNQGATSAQESERK